MTEIREFNGRRFYNLCKIIVICVTLIMAFQAGWLFIDLKTNRTLTNYQDYCAKHPDPPGIDPYFSCMSEANQTISKMSEQSDSALRIAVILPVIFFGTTLLYEYLFPVKNRG